MLPPYASKASVNPGISKNLCTKGIKAKSAIVTLSLPNTLAIKKPWLKNYSLTGVKTFIKSSTILGVIYSAFVASYNGSEIESIYTFMCISIIVFSRMLIWPVERRG